eukprot:gene4574-17672_t
MPPGAKKKKKDVEKKDEDKRKEGRKEDKKNDGKKEEKKEGRNGGTELATEARGKTAEHRLAGDADPQSLGFFNAFAVLGEEVTKAYRTKSKEVHPDKQKEGATTEAFQARLSLQRDVDAAIRRRLYYNGPSFVDADPAGCTRLLGLVSSKWLPALRKERAEKRDGEAARELAVAFATLPRQQLHKAAGVNPFGHKSGSSVHLLVLW